MLRLNFTAEDLARVVLAGPAVAQASEAVLSLQILRRRDQQARYGAWQQNLMGSLPFSIRPMLDLVPVHGWVPDFLTPAESLTVPNAVEAIRATPTRQITSELNRLATTHRLPSWVSGLAHGDSATLSAVTTGLVDYHGIAIAPYLDRMQAALDADRASRTTTLTKHGTGAMLAGLHPALRWESPVLTLPAPTDGDIHLAGRGLILAPLVFCGPLPRLLLSTFDDRPFLAYPSTLDQVPPLAGPGPDQPAATVLAKALGSARTTILHTIAATPGLSTGALATRAGISLASASEHATTLRKTGLITSHRDGNRIRHYPTATGTALLRAPHASQT